MGKEKLHRRFAMRSHKYEEGDGFAGQDVLYATDPAESKAARRLALKLDFFWGMGTLGLPARETE